MKSQSKFYTQECNHRRTVATETTMVAPKFSDTLTLSQPRARFCSPLQMSQLTFNHGYAPDIYQKRIYELYEIKYDLMNHLTPLCRIERDDDDL